MSRARWVFITLGLFRLRTLNIQRFGFHLLNHIWSWFCLQLILSAPSETAFFGVDEIRKKKKEENRERKNLLNALWFVGLTKGGQFEVWHLDRQRFLLDPFTEGVESTRENSVCLSVCLSVITFSFSKYFPLFPSSLLLSSPDQFRRMAPWEIQHGQQFLLDPSTEGVESTRENSAYLSVCLSVITFSFSK